MFPCTQLMCCAGPQIEKVSYPALASSPDRALATKLFGGRGGGVLSFVLRGSMTQTKVFLGVMPKLLIYFSCASCFVPDPESLAPCNIAHQICTTACGSVPSASKSVIAPM